MQRLWQERATWGRGGAACRGAGLLCTGQARFPERWPYYVVPSGFLSPSAWRGWPGLGSLGKRRPVEDTGGPGGHPEVCTAPLERGGFTWQLGSDSQAKNVGTHHRIGSPWSGASDTNLPAGMGGGRGRGEEGNKGGAVPGCHVHVPHALHRTEVSQTFVQALPRAQPGPIWLRVAGGALSQCVCVHVHVCALGWRAGERLQLIQDS